MTRLFSLPLSAALAIAGVGGGILGGNSTSNSIDPFFYSPLPTRSFASYSAYRSPTSGGELSAEETASAMGGCVGCNTYPEEYRPDSSYEEAMAAGYHAASLGAERGYRSDAIEVEVPVIQASEDPDRSAVARYASYPVNQTERDLRAIEQRAAEQNEQAVAERADAETLRAAEDNAVPRGPEQLVY